MTTTNIPTLVSFAAVVLLAATVAHGRTAARYEAVFSDGTRLEGDKVSGWHEHPGSPRLDNTALSDAKRPLRWLRDNNLKAWRPGRGDAYIEFVGGDRIVGRIVDVGAGAGPYVPVHLLVKPAAPLHQPVRGVPVRVRVLPERITRVVFGPASRRRLQPGNIYYRDGRRQGFVHLRWKAESVVLLLKDGTREVKISDMAEAHLPRIDPWKAYFRELAILNPACRSRMVRIETTGGLIATSSSLRFDAMGYGNPHRRSAVLGSLRGSNKQIASLEGKREANRLKFEQARAKYQRESAKSGTQEKAADLKRQFEEEAKRWKAFLASLESLKSRRATVLSGTPQTWLHIIQPVWSLDLLSIPFRSIRMRWSFAPARVPLCRVRPAATVSPPLLPWYINRNSTGKPLRSGGDEYAWGFAVHAYSELRFPLPQCASAFRSSIGLDRMVGAGGCARARVYVGSTAGKPAYESPLLIGSKKTVDTGRIALKLPTEGPGHLVLQADPAHDNRPRDADPLNVRDKLDWLDPLLELDTSGLQDQVHLQAGPVLAASPGWKLKLDKRGVYTRTNYLHKPGKSGPSRFLAMIRAQTQPLRVSREMTIGPADKWLAVYVSLSTGVPPEPDAVVLRVGERRVQPWKIPIKQHWQDWGAPLLFGIDEYQDKRVTLELTQAIGGKPLHWQAVRTATKLPRAYRLARTLELMGRSNFRIPRALASALHSPRINKQEKTALIEIYQHGGIMNFGRPTSGNSRPNDINNMLVGEDWKGGDKSFMAFQKTPSVKSIILVKDSGVSSAAVEKLLAVMPGLKIEHFERLPSRLGRMCIFWMQNRSGKEVGIYWITQGGELSLRDTLDKSGNRKRHYSNVGCRFEARVDGKPISKFTVTPGRIWEIRPPGK